MTAKDTEGVEPNRADVLEEARQMRARVLTLAQAALRQIKVSFAEPRKSPNAQVLMQVGPLMQLLDLVQTFADGFVGQVDRTLQARDAAARAADSVRSQKVLRGRAESQLKQHLGRCAGVTDDGAALVFEGVAEPDGLEDSGRALMLSVTHEPADDADDGEWIRLHSEHGDLSHARLLDVLGRRVRVTVEVLETAEEALARETPLQEGLREVLLEKLDKQRQRL